jgi:DNA topoisomerase-6 subunit B
MATSKITKSSTAEYFSKNLQQVGFSSPIKAVLTTLKEAVDNSLDACEQEGILPEVSIEIKKVGQGSSKNTDLIKIVVEDNGPGIEADDLAKVFGEYLASSKFGKGQCSRGQQGIGISAATTWAQLTNAKGAFVKSKTSSMRKAITGQVDVDIKSNTGVLKNKETVDWDKKSGVRVEFVIDGRVQLNGDGGLITYIEGTVLVNPHLSLNYKLLDQDWVKIERVSTAVPEIPQPTLPHPHTFKLGELITHATLFGKTNLDKFLKTGFSRINDQSIKEFVAKGLPKNLLNKPISTIKDEEFKKVFQAMQEVQLMAPSTKSVMTVSEEALSKSIQRLGQIDFFSVVTRKPAICDFKPVVVEVALARFINRNQEADEPVQLLRFANRVPLQFDKSGCAITWAIESVNWKNYGLAQPKNSLPIGPYVFAVAVTSPFIKFKNASKETIDASEELVEEIRRALMQAGQKLSRHIKKEFKEADLERKLAHIEQFGPILVECLVRITKSNAARAKKAEEGLKKLLGRDSADAKKDLEDAEMKLSVQKQKQRKKLGLPEDDDDGAAKSEEASEFNEEQLELLPSDSDDESSSGKTTKKLADTTKKMADTTKKQADTTKKQADTTKKMADTTKKQADTTKKKVKIDHEKELEG